MVNTKLVPNNLTSNKAKPTTRKKTSEEDRTTPKTTSCQNSMQQCDFICYSAVKKRKTHISSIHLYCTSILFIHGKYCSLSTYSTGIIIIFLNHSSKLCSLMFFPVIRVYSEVKRIHLTTLSQRV